MDRKLLIIGAGGHGKVVKETAETLGCYETIDFLDDNSEVAVGKCDDYEKFKTGYRFCFVAVGNNELRMNWYFKLKNSGYEIPALIHPGAYVSPSAEIKSGSFIGPNSVVNTGSVIEQGCIISAGAVVDHDSLVNEFSHIDAGAIVKSNFIVTRLTKVNAGTVASVENSQGRSCH